MASHEADVISVHDDTRAYFAGVVDQIFRTGSLSVGRVSEDLELLWSRLHLTAGSVVTSSGTTALELASRPFYTADRPCALVPALSPPMVKWAVERAGFRVVYMDVDATTGCSRLSDVQA